MERERDSDDSEVQRHETEREVVDSLYKAALDEDEKRQSSGFGKLTVVLSIR